MKRLHFIICLIFLDSFVLVYSSLLMTRHALLDGYTCPGSAIRFDEPNWERIQCVLLCADNSSCFGVFHDQVKRRCIGCGDKYLTHNSAPVLSGTQYYKRRTHVLDSEMRSWNMSKEYCQELGGHLADIKTEEERNFIGNQVFDSVHANFTWIGEAKYELDPEAGTQVDRKHCVLMNTDDPWTLYYGTTCGDYHLSLCEFD